MSLRGAPFTIEEYRHLLGAVLLVLGVWLVVWGLFRKIDNNDQTTEDQQ